MTLHGVLTADYLYRNYLTRLPPLDFLEDIDPKSGAVGANRIWRERGERYPNVRRQEIGELLVCHGLTTGSSEKSSLGIKVLSYGLSLQNIDGSFPGDAPGRFCYPSTAFFLCSVCSALLMLSSAQAPNTEAMQEEWRPHLIRAASWLAKEPPHFPELTNQVCGAAGAVSMVSALYPTKDIIAASRHLCQMVSGLQNEDGSWPEYGGTDSFYQAISLIYAIYALLTCPEEKTHHLLREALNRGFGWLASCVGEDGSVDCTHNTRKRWDRLPPDNGAISASDFAAVYYAFRMWGDITGDARWTSLAESVDAWIARVKPGGDRNRWELLLAGEV